MKRTLTALLAVAGGYILSAGPAPADMPPPPPQPPKPAAAPDDLPKVLSKADVRRYRRIFALGGPGAWDKADALIAELDNRILVGHALAQRYLHPTAYYTPFNELRAWLKRYHDHPQAHSLYELAMQRRPGGAGPVHRPTYTRASVAELPGGTHDPETVFDGPRAYGRERAQHVLWRVRTNVNRTRLSITEAYLQRDNVRGALRADEMGWARAKVAAGWYYYGDDREARAIATDAAARTGEPYAHWIAGLAAWRQGDLKPAGEHFAAVATADDAPVGKQAAGAYWAARAHIRLREPAEMGRWLRRAAAHPDTFYGQLARAALGTTPDIRMRPPEPPEGAFRELRTHPAGRRALALMQVGKRELAKRELLGMPGWDERDSAATLLLAAERGGLSAFAHDMARHMSEMPAARWRQAAVNAARYPIPLWRPHTGFRIDRALLYAVMRKESGYEPVARSGAGARGLMQIMPATARFVAERNNLRYTDYNFSRPAWSLNIAQQYLRYLLDRGSVDGNLIRLLTAYNAGPGNLRRWLDEVDHGGDPLLFIESIPSAETRRYVEEVMRNVWFYRGRLGEAAPSRRMLAAGRVPRYGVGGDEQEIARK
ncbi:Soluble lytic murein transglycosylase [Limimonas halophila]|uniref:Soluble lytic murein transglycosylase n=1 Tax=Limimonas halophila TaxID=1082479 RepID=A0A1G7S1I3_9PROT|nr:lytic transglycosylase domain-containing protein [Limimonas halophila]SDG16877.1 Soluble lytic murein transglycosylase [Limimonas halophila]